MQQRQTKPKRHVKGRKTAKKRRGSVRPEANEQHREDFERLLDDAVLGPKQR